MSGAPPKLVRPYRDFLTPLLHRRFTSAAIWSLLSCYAVASWQGEFDILWSWFPLGPTGLRTSFLFIAVLMSYVLHISQLHVRKTYSPSLFQDFFRFARSWQAVNTVLWHLLSAIMFCEAYVWSASDDSNLKIVDPGRPYERPRLNERPIYLRTLFMLLGLQQAVWHLYRDMSRVDVPALKLDTAGADVPKQSPGSLLKDKLVPIIVDASTRMLVMSVVGPLIYASILRHSAWHWNFAVARRVFTLPKSSKPSRMPPFVGDLVLRYYVEGTLLLILWEFASAAFRVYIAEPPIKKGLPLTSDAPDPNGSLLQGLKAKKEYPRTFAFWELAVISGTSPTRREAIYRDIDRVGGSTWSQLVMICLGELHAVSTRINDYQNPSVPVAAGASQIHTLPKLSGPLKDGNVFTNPPPPAHTLAAQFGSFARAHGQSPGATDPVSPQARKLLTMGADTFMSKETKQALSQSFVGGTVKSYIIEFLKTPMGWPFRQTFVRRLSGIVLGSPSSSTNASIISDATTSLAKLATFSIKEDRYGRVNKDVANIMRTFTLTIQAIENFVKTLEVDWTDVMFDQRKEPDPHATASNVFGAGEIEAGRRVAAVDEVLGALKESLSALIGEFAEFREELGLTIAELRRAREVVGGVGAGDGSMR